MRLVVQRVTSAKVSIEGEIHSSIGHGLLVLLGIHQDDRLDAITYLIEKILYLRIFHDNDGKMNLDIRQVHGSILVVSQFTLYGDCTKGRRPSFAKAASPEHARDLYENFLYQLKASYLAVQSGVFAAKMDIALVNDGPVTFVLDSP